MYAIPTDAREHFGRAIKAARGDRHWSQKKLAQELDLSLATVRKLEQGANKSIQPITAAKLRQVFDWTEQQLDDALNGRHPAPSNDTLRDATEQRAGRPLTEDEWGTILATMDAILARRSPTPQ